MANGERITNVDIRDRLDALRLEVKSDINSAVATVSSNQGRLEKMFYDLEQGRITRLEAKYQDLAIIVQRGQDANKQAVSTLNAKAVIVGIILTAFLYGVANALIIKTLR